MTHVQARHDFATSTVDLVLDSHALQLLHDRAWTRLWAGQKGKLDDAGITVRVVMCQKEEHVGWARRDWKLPSDWILGDETLTVAHAIKNAGVADISISPHSWHPDSAKEKPGSYKKHPEYNYPHGMHQPAVVMLRKLEPKAQACDGCEKKTLNLFMDPNEHGTEGQGEGDDEKGTVHYAVKDKSKRRYCTGCAKPGVHTRKVPATEMGGAFPPADPIYTNISTNHHPRAAPKQCAAYLVKATAAANKGEPVPPVDGNWEKGFGVGAMCCKLCCVVM